MFLGRAGNFRLPYGSSRDRLRNLSQEEKHSYRQQALGILGLLRVIGYVAVEREVLATAAEIFVAQMPPL